MDNRNGINWMFNASGNLTFEAMQAYLEGKLNREQAEVFENHLKVSEFDREALEGLRLTTSERASASIAGLNERISGRSRQRRKITFWPYYGIAASVVLIAGVIGVLNYLENRQPETISQALPPQEEKAVEEKGAEKTTQSGDEARVETKEESTYQLVPVEQEDKKPESVVGVLEEDIIPETDQQTDVLVDDNITLTEEAGKKEGAGKRTGEGIGERSGRGEEESGAGYEMEEEVSNDIGDIEAAEASKKSLETTRKPVAMKAQQEPQEEEEIFMVVEEMPAFPGGDTALANYLYRNIEYPAEAVENGTEGKVYVSFMVAKDGKIKNVRILRGIGHGCDEEALRVIRAMPDWKPGKQRGKPVRVQVNLPIVFEME